MAGHLDLARLQMLFITLELVTSYSVALAAVLSGSQAVRGFPELDAGVLALMGIGHAAYLANKAVPHSKD